MAGQPVPCGVDPTASQSGAWWIIVSRTDDTTRRFYSSHDSKGDAESLASYLNADARWKRKNGIPRRHKWQVIQKPEGSDD